ncbi:MAG: carbohydrate binding domain-containing protein [Lentisphaeria bacterium]
MMPFFHGFRGFAMLAAMALGAGFGCVWVGEPTAVASTLAGDLASDAGCELSYWAPGILNQAEGTVEMDVVFRVPREDLTGDYQNLISVSGNGGPGVGVSILSLVLCPPVDGRDLSVVVRGPQSAAYMSVPCPPLLEAPGKETVRRLAVSWGNGEAGLWFDGRKLAAKPFRGGLAQLPERLRVGYALDSGVQGGYHVRALRISAAARTGAELAGRLPLAADGQTTLLAGDGMAQAPVTAWQKDGYRAGLFPVRRASSFVTPAGQAIKLPLRGVNYSGGPVRFEVTCAVRDRAGTAVAKGKWAVTVAPGAHYRPFAIALPAMEESGYHEAVVTIAAAGEEGASYDIAFVNQPRDAGNLKPGKLADYLGHHHLFGVKPNAFSQLGIQWHRAWARERCWLWCVVEPGKGKFHWEAADRSVAAARREGLQLLGVLGYPPAWASTYSEAEMERLKGLGKLGRYSRNPDRYQPKSLDEWKAYVRAVVERYHGQVKYWEIYNEVDFHPPAMHATFSGSTREYLELLKSAAAVIKGIDPSCQVLTSGFSLSPGITDAEMAKDLLALGAARHFDIFNVHGYTDLGTLADNTRAVRAAKPGVPLWMSEYMYEQPTDDYQVVYKALWFLSQGYAKFFLHGGELDRNYGELKITPFYAVTAELARQLRVCDQYLGAVEGTDGRFHSWEFRRTDGSSLNVFAVENGRVLLTLAPTQAPLELGVTDLYGKSLFRGVPKAAAPLEVTGMLYVVSSEKLRIAKAVREHGNIIANGGFEKREGDYMADESLARPVSWDLRPWGTSPGAMSFVPGKTGNYALKLATAGALKSVATGQVVSLDVPGGWILSADVKISQGGSGEIVVEQNQAGTWKTIASERLMGTGEWKTITLRLKIAGENTKGVVKIGLDSENSHIEIDNVQMVLDSANQR